VLAAFSVVESTPEAPRVEIVDRHASARDRGPEKRPIDQRDRVSCDRRVDPPPAPNRDQEGAMRFMMIMHPNAGTAYEGPGTPDVEAVAAMTTYNKALVEAGILLAGEGLAGPAKGARIRFSGGRSTVVDGPFPEAKEIIGGYWMIQVRSKEEAVEWARRCPAADGDMIELRQVFEMEDFPPDVQEAANM
jgi:hypothetical protein